MMGIWQHRGAVWGKTFFIAETLNMQQSNYVSGGVKQGKWTSFRNEAEVDVEVKLDDVSVVRRCLGFKSLSVDQTSIYRELCWAKVVPGGSVVYHLSCKQPTRLKLKKSPPHPQLKIVECSSQITLVEVFVGVLRWMEITDAITFFPSPHHKSTAL